MYSSSSSDSSDKRKFQGLWNERKAEKTNYRNQKWGGTKKREKKEELFKFKFKLVYIYTIPENFKIIEKGKWVFNQVNTNPGTQLYKIDEDPLIIQFKKEDKTPIKTIREKVLERTISKELLKFNNKTKKYGIVKHHPNTLLNETTNIPEETTDPSIFYGHKRIPLDISSDKVQKHNTGTLESLYHSSDTLYRLYKALEAGSDYFEYEVLSHLFSKDRYDTDLSNSLLVNAGPYINGVWKYWHEYENKVYSYNHLTRKYIKPIQINNNAIKNRPIPYELDGVRRLNGLLKLEFLYSKKFDMRLYLCHDRHTKEGECGDNLLYTDVISWLKTIILTDDEGFDVFLESTSQRNVGVLESVSKIGIQPDNRNDTAEFDFKTAKDITKNDNDNDSIKLDSLRAFNLFATKEMSERPNNKLQYSTNTRFHATDLRYGHLSYPNMPDYEDRIMLEFVTEDFKLKLKEYKNYINNFLKHKMVSKSKANLRNDFNSSELIKILDKVSIPDYKFQFEHVFNITLLESDPKDPIPFEEIFAGGYLAFYKSSEVQQSSINKYKVIKNAIRKLRILLEAKIVDVTTLYSLFRVFPNNKKSPVVRNGILYFGTSHAEHISKILHELGFETKFETKFETSASGNKRSSHTNTQCLTIKSDLINSSPLQRWSTLFKNLHNYRMDGIVTFNILEKKYNNYKKNFQKPRRFLKKNFQKPRTFLRYFIHEIFKWVFVYSLKCYGNESPDHLETFKSKVATQSLESLDTRIDETIRNLLSYIVHFQSLDASYMFGINFISLISSWKKVCRYSSELHRNKESKHKPANNIKRRRLRRSLKILMSKSYLIIRIFENSLVDSHKIIANWKSITVMLIDMAYLDLKVPNDGTLPIEELFLEFTRSFTKDKHYSTLKQSTLPSEIQNKTTIIISNNNSSNSSSSSSNTDNSRGNSAITKKGTVVSSSSFTGDTFLNSKLTVVHGFIEI